MPEERGPIRQRYQERCTTRARQQITGTDQRGKTRTRLTLDGDGGQVTRQMTEKRSETVNQRTQESEAQDVTLPELSYG